VDLLFVDIVHGYHQTKRALGLFANRLKPRVIVMDDIALNAGMRTLWAELADVHPAADVSDLWNAARRESGSSCRGIHVSSTRDAWRVPVWAARRAVSARLSYGAKAQITSALERLPEPLRRFVDPS
jgi:hypothetical protein